ncbi:hypothetical protein [Domibacillus mangrovi]|uniref:Helix-turn-helix domain-containing protein n=1 Tax=Domibacillus mangrovi TaxID=1714354 RepID=A0A1Q5NZK3_9BACI|nr:hypothetical protein [Domibacillus mangrovi]OKL35282.1 hypothetical protein BLL40_16160 [Domibacillus mangrovi]
MTISKLVSNKEFKQMMSRKVYAENHEQQQSMKSTLLKAVEKAYGERYWRLKEGTRQAIDMMCWFASERGFYFAKDHYFADRFDVSDKTIRNVTKMLREAGVMFTIYRRSSTQNGRSAPVHLFVDHPYFSHWEEQLELSLCQTDCQAEKDETPCRSKDESAKKDSTSYISLLKSFKTLRKEEHVLDHTFTPSYVPKEFIQAVSPFFDDAKVIDRLWRKTQRAYRTSSLNLSQEELLFIVMKSFKDTIFAHKHNRIKGSFDGYFFGTLRNQFKKVQEQSNQTSLETAVGQEQQYSFAIKKAIRTEQLPEWFVQQRQGNDQVVSDTDHDELFLIEKAKLEAILREKQHSLR